MLLALLAASCGRTVVPPPPAATEEQLRKAKDAFERAGVGYVPSTDPLSKQPVHTFVPLDAGFAQKQLPNPPFAFGLDLTQIGWALQGTPNLGAEEFKALQGLKNLTSLKLSCGRQTGAGLKELKDLPHLTTLYLYYGETSTGVEELKDFRNLTTLRINGTVSDADLKELKGLRNLTTLILDLSEVTDGALRSLREVGLLYALRQAGGKGGKRPASAEEVTSLILRDDNDAPVQRLFKVTGKGLRELRDLRNLAVLDLSRTQVTDAELAELKGLKDLATLTLDEGEGRGGQVTDVMLRTLREIGLLHAWTRARAKGGKRPGAAEDVIAVDLRGLSRITEAGLNELRGLPNLSTLILGSPEFDFATINDRGLEKELKRPGGSFHTQWKADTWLKEVAGLKALTSLHIHGVGVTAAGLAELKDLPNLTTLDLFGCSVRAEQLKSLSSLPSLATLDLRGVPSANACLRELKNIKKLSTLIVGVGGHGPNVFQPGTDLTDAEVVELQRALPGCKIKR